MHMADALISPAVGGTMWAVSAGAVAVAARRLADRSRADCPVSDRTALMGVLGAFAFAAQMINFTIPWTGSSGHLAGGVMLAALLGPHAALLAIASVLIVQALFFADGGLLALGCNLFNMGFLACYVVYPLVYRTILGPSGGGERPARRRIWAASLVGGVAALQLGAAAVVMETTASGISELPFGAFLTLMLPIHFAIGLVEGAITAAVICFVAEARPEVLIPDAKLAGGRVREMSVALAAATVLIAGALSWFASSRPDGLEWSIARVAVADEVPSPSTGAHPALARLQERTAAMPDYDFRQADEQGSETGGATGGVVRAGVSSAGLLGALLTLLLAGTVGLILRRRPIRKPT